MSGTSRPARGGGDGLTGIGLRLAGIERSGIRQIMDQALSRSDVVRLEVGEPDHPTPAHIVEAVGATAAAGLTRYTSGRGVPALREAVARKVARVNRIGVDPDTDVVVTAGAANGLLISLAVVAGPGDAVLIPDPGWPNYVGMTRTLGLRDVRYAMEASSGFQPDPEAVEDLMVRTGAACIVINSPHNPTGTVIGSDRLRRIADAAERHGCALVFDECYDQVVLDGEPAPSLDPNSGPLVINVFSLSKTYAMTGWRVGYVVSDAATIRHVAQIQEMWLSCVSAPIQGAAAVALDGDQAAVDRYVASYRERRDLSVALAGELGLSVHRPGGAFYLMVEVGHHPGGSMGFARRLLDVEGVAVAPGDTFGAESARMVRISLAADVRSLERGLRAIATQVM